MKDRWSGPNLPPNVCEMGGCLSSDRSEDLSDTWTATTTGLPFISNKGEDPELRRMRLMPKLANKVRYGKKLDIWERDLWNKWGGDRYYATVYYGAGKVRGVTPGQVTRRSTGKNQGMVNRPLTEEEKRENRQEVLKIRQEGELKKN